MLSAPVLAPRRDRTGADVRGPGIGFPRPTRSSCARRAATSRVRPPMLTGGARADMESRDSTERFGRGPALAGSDGGSADRPGQGARPETKAAANVLPRPYQGRVHFV